MSSAELALSLRFQALYRGHHGWLRNWLWKHLGCSETAADLAQDTFLRILLKDAASQIESPRAYLATVARALMINHWRRQALEQAYLELLAMQPEPLLPSLEEQAVVLETLAQLGELLDGLPQRCRQVFLLVRLDGLSYQEVAVRLGISVNMVQKAMARAMQNCYRVLYS